jgi:DNA-nicking Smr family endonuclease
MAGTINLVGQAVRRDADEADLFREAVRDATPLADRQRVRATADVPARAPAGPRRAPRQSGPLEVEPSGGRAFGVSRKTLRELAAGRTPPEATLDLHRHTARAAQERLTRFVAESRTAGRRSVLVITGKGDHSRSLERLRDLVPVWLAGPLAPAILAFTPARAEHGGAGALYVLLRTATP